MFLLNSMKRAKYEGFRIGYQDVNPFQYVIPWSVLLWIDNLLVMDQSDVLDDVVGRKTIGTDRLARGYTFRQGRLDCLAVDVLNHFHFCEGDGFVFHGGHDDNGNLACNTPALVATFVDSAFEKGVIDLDESSQLVPGVASFHRFANLMQHSPRALEADINLLRQRQSRETSFIHADEENCPEPFDQRRSGPVHDRACGEGRLMPALNTLKKNAISNVVRLLAATPRASEAIRPPQIKKSLSASRFHGERPLEGDEVHLGVGLWHKCSSTN